MAYHWPGNVRQLQNVVRSVVVLNDGEFVTPDLFPREILAAGGSARLPISPPPPPAFVTQELLEPQAPPAAAASTQSPPQPAPSAVRALRSLEDVIRETIEEAIAQCGGSIPKAAAALDVSPSTLYRRIQGWESADGMTE